MRQNKKEQVLSVRMSTEFRDWLFKEAAKEGVSPSDYIRLLVLKAMVKA